MTSTTSDEIFWLTLTAIYTVLLIAPYAFVRVRRIGWQFLTNPLPGDDPFQQAWAHRAYRAHMNAIENIAIFAPLALGVQVSGANNEVTALACATYFWARVIHAPFYILNTPYVRTLAFFVGVGACFTLAWQILS